MVRFGTVRLSSGRLACDLPPALETVEAVTRAVEEESRDVRAGVLR